MRLSPDAIKAEETAPVTCQLRSGPAPPPAARPDGWQRTGVIVRAERGRGRRRQTAAGRLPFPFPFPSLSRRLARRCAPELARRQTGHAGARALNAQARAASAINIPYQDAGNFYYF